MQSQSSDISFRVDIDTVSRQQIQQSILQNAFSTSPAIDLSLYPILYCVKVFKANYYKQVLVTPGKQCL